MAIVLMKLFEIYIFIFWGDSSSMDESIESIMSSSSFLFPLNHIRVINLVELVDGVCWDE
ncbi:hypothetical protein LAZ67_5001378 [Cordylochernes scorpioides]|uniref:Uncharacterized protein n=1 Tax=Cordylochernes scorpioides TaxID=51811 RepID=A0ABY6KFL1_9ARAC|nr:hypothetical protein LAZ67_5001378 [Cordylochernes scorpioides]